MSGLSPWKDPILMFVRTHSILLKVGSQKRTFQLSNIKIHMNDSTPIKCIGNQKIADMIQHGQCTCHYLDLPIIVCFFLLNIRDF